MWGDSFFQLLEQGSGLRRYRVPNERKVSLLGRFIRLLLFCLFLFIVYVVVRMRMWAYLG